LQSSCSHEKPCSRLISRPSEISSTSTKAPKSCSLQF
jgi:hypothetical protein